MAKVETISGLEERAREIRIDILRMLNAAGSGHTGGSLSCVEILTALYFKVMRHRPEDPDWKGRDRFVLSKGHAAPTFYAVLAHAGYFDREELLTLRKLGSRLQGHPARGFLPGIEVSTGSLGQGLTMACGIALALRLDDLNTDVYAVLGDGEVQEGLIWEAAMSAAHRHLDNLCAIIDHNNLQIDGKVEEIKGIEPLEDKWRAFGWEVFHANGHDLKDLLDAFDAAKGIKGKPSVIIAKTVKGKGSKLFENKVEYHGVAPTDEELKIALKELGAD